MANTREHILNVSFKLFLHKSFKEVTLKEIVENTGLSKGAFYHYFESKEQLFLEIINNAISTVVDVYEEKLSKQSLYQYYHDYFTHFKDMANLFPQNNNQETGFESNIYSLFFDGIKLFPDFQKKLIESVQYELDKWKEIVQIARNKGEIKSSMTDEQIAKMFVYSSDGVGIHNIIMKKSSEDIRTTLLDLWDSFYEQLKK